ncbi:SpoIID/LytB domain-containing protein [Pantanalinema sp. GBBB05]|uniref:SpoIID/LytB domain-containing protein n=1 Tax=Pantanalinema sp. GBBB05 TaxID=2604139 RepID=UPI001DD1ED30|nr:SpoIID/LytB domain-containing protein [Pantanalinema sp. GBBB05]
MRVQPAFLNRLAIPPLLSLSLLSGTALAVSTLLGSQAKATQASNPQNPELYVGIVQRFGSKPTDSLTLQARSGDRLTVRFKTNGQEQAVTGTTAKLEIVTQALPEPKLEERVVLSTHRSFESAEADANRWRSQGIEVEVAQPERWQVWAKRDVYSNPVVRRLLLQNLQSKGIQTAYLDSRVVQKQPKSSLVLNGYRYNRDYVDISSTQGVIQVSPIGDERSRNLYAGSLRLQPNTYGNYTLVNRVPVETYLRGVVPHEIGTWAAPSVLQTQAILARTYALRNLRRFAIDGYQLCADTQCQVYNGLSGTASATDRAIAATKGLVLTYQNELVDAVYSSTTGGVTAAFHDIWQGSERPYLKGVLDSVGSPWDLARYPLTEEQNLRRFISQKNGFNEEGTRWFRWRAESRLAELTKELKTYLASQNSPLARFKAIQQLQVLQRSPSGRVLKLAVITDLGTVELEKDNILKVFYAPNSTLFYLEPLYGANKSLQGYAFVGGGLGHGVGLSQTGSYRLGDLGWSSDRILSFYYPGTQLQPLNAAIVFWREPATEQVSR